MREVVDTNYLWGSANSFWSADSKFGTAFTSKIENKTKKFATTKKDL